MNALESCDVPAMRVPDMERIRAARRKRQQQLKRWVQYDKTMEKKEKRTRTSTSPPPGSTPGGRQHPGFVRSVQFSQAVILLEAAARDDLNEVRKLLNQGVCPNVTNMDGLTALHQCCIDNNQEMCRLLIRFGADVNARDTELWTPLHAAATCCHADLCKLLIDNGADLLAVNADGNMPYDICEDDATLDLIESEMASRGITQEDIDEKRRVPEREMLAAMEHLVKTSGDLNQLDSQGAAPLHIAAACGYLDVVGFLLQHGANIDLPDRDGWMAIHVAACWGQYEVIEMLTNFGAKLDTPTVNGGETVFDICEDEKLHERLVLLREELKRWQSFHLVQNQINASNGNSDVNNRNRGGLSRRRSSNPRRQEFLEYDQFPRELAEASSIRRTSMRDKAKLSWKEARQEAETCSLVVPTADGDSVEEVVKTPVWMTAVDDSNGGPIMHNSNPPEAPHPPPDTHRRWGAQPSNSLPANARLRPSNALPIKSTPDPSVVDGPRLSSHKSDSLGRKRAAESPQLRPRLTSRLGESVAPIRAPNGAQPSSQAPPPPAHQQQTIASANGVGQTNVHLHNAYYSLGSQQPSTAAKGRLQGRVPPHILLSTGAKPVVSTAPGVIASPLQPGASLTRPPLKRDLLINDSRKLEESSSGNSGKCCVLM
ncbi:Protein phosphatase 1 regulatory inhibitor subunit [Echinococcus granulosus]|uniref:Protein phosphatase 1 regulatory inhibitor subunit n=1 Tax=Echinococcus granulosus TaxID=6210 RepID=W6UP99_ECHGR|nr:Protein phosphatase 1 regulatory inhibitor subunit [Echinococcus granulosus]EUB62591.1 Protein phosphatase 1 regulatory inhibitor subunit [Echinococcus granulosus]